MTQLPVEAVIPALKQALAERTGAVLVAAPGAGKTTRVPLALLEEPWLQGQRIVMLEPRRLAARSAARYMASALGEPIGETVGFRVRHETRVGTRTRLEVVTEGVLTRMLQTDPALEGVGLVIFDEFHERNLQGDLGLALTQETQAVLREDLRVLVMSATLEAEPVAELLGGVPIIRSEGRMFPVETRFLPRRAEGFVEQTVARVCVEALEREEGDVLVFLPGAPEIRRTQRRLLELGIGGAAPSAQAADRKQVVVVELHGSLPQGQQDQALGPAGPGVRKIVLATSIAETSLTVEGVRIVVDSGLSRVPRFSPRTGMTRLETVPVSRAAADQRRGRAGRLGPGVCYRLWTEADDCQLAPSDKPELLEADLAAVALELAAWGAAPEVLRWLDPPPPAALQQARDLLAALGALDGSGSITAHGKRMAAFGAHPRLAHMMLRGAELGLGGLACELAALLGERDVLRQAADGDVRLRVEALRRAVAPGVGGVARGSMDSTASNPAARRAADTSVGMELGAGSGTMGPVGSMAAGIDVAACRRIAETAERWHRDLGLPTTLFADAPRGLAPRNEPPRAHAASSGVSPTHSPSVLERVAGSSSAESPDRCGLLLALAYPDRIGRRRSGTRFLLRSGRGAAFVDLQPLASAEYIVAAELDDQGAESRIYLAAPVGRDELEEHMPEAFTEEADVRWDKAAQAVRARRRVRLGAIVVEEGPLSAPDPSAVQAALLLGIAETGLELLPWSKAARQLRARIGYMHRYESGEWPDVSGEGLLATLPIWLGPHVFGMKNRDELQKLNLTTVLEALLPWSQRTELDTLVPTHVTVPSGSRLPIDYSDPESPALAVRLQELFGLAETPRIARGRVPLTLQLLSPAHRPVQVTRDLASFWREAYFDVKKDLKGRYPKHYWPEDPLIAEPTSRTRPRQGPPRG